MRLTGALFFVVEASPPWVADAPSATTLSTCILPRAGHVVSYHVVLEGKAWARVSDEGPFRLDAGDVLVIPQGDPYTLSSAPDLSSTLSQEEVLGFFRAMAGGEVPFTLQEGGGGPESLRVLCGFLGCDALPFNPIFAALPRSLQLHPPSEKTEDRLAPLIELALGESRERRAGGHCALLRISELMCIEVVRRYLEIMPANRRGWLAGLRDPVVGRALGLLHQQIARTWTLEELGRETGLSRSVLAERFTHYIGRPPMQYLADWRMQVAAGLLADGTANVSAVALEVGYRSEAAFSRAFKKRVGVPPSSWRDRSAAEAPGRSRPESSWRPRAF